MKLIWAEEAQEDYQHWCLHEPRIRDKINALIEDIQRSPFRGIGKPEPLRYEWSGFWSRRITGTHRLVYRVKGGELQIAQCRYHYHK